MAAERILKMLRIFLLGFLLTYHHTEVGAICESQVLLIVEAANDLKGKREKDPNYNIPPEDCKGVRSYIKNMVTSPRVLFCVTTIQAVVQKYLTEYNILATTCKTGGVLKNLTCHDGDKLATCLETMPKALRKKTKCTMCKDGDVTWYDKCYENVTCNEFVENAKESIQLGCDVCRGKPRYATRRPTYNDGVALVRYSLYLGALAILPFFWEIICIVQKSI